jgi:hypothetical protein
LANITRSIGTAMSPHEDIQLDASTLADWVGACSATLTPLDRIRRHVLAADRIAR